MNDKIVSISDFNGSWDVKMAHTVEANYTFIDGKFFIQVAGTTSNGHYSVNKNGEKMVLIAATDILEIEMLTDKFIVAKKPTGEYYLFVKRPQ